MPTTSTTFTKRRVTHTREPASKTWRVEDQDGSPVVHAYELDVPTRSLVPTGIHRHELRTTTPFAIKLDLDGLVPVRKS